MFCSLCRVVEPCGKEGCWIVPGGWEYEKVRFSGMLRGEYTPRKLGIPGFNCDVKLGVNERCPHCNQFHLRPGYCQALNPANAAQYELTTEADHATEKVTTHGQADHASVTTLSTPLTEPEVEMDEEEMDKVAKRKADKARNEKNRRARLRAAKGGSNEQA